MIRVGDACRIIAAFDVPVVRRKIERSPTSVREIDVGALVDQVCREFVIGVLGRR
jgi:hypothetical protein